MSCPSTDTITCKVFVMSREQYLISSDIYVTVERLNDSCNDIAHAIDSGVCLPICPYSSSRKHCVQKSVLPGY